jgi:DNA-directed RNA polymerase subunit RPC12/RpoP
VTPPNTSGIDSNVGMRGRGLASNRRAIGKRTRFEIFKRDAFTCQYCGGTPPGSTLHVDHIKPVVDGGTNDPDNLVTACLDCNLGKGAISLDAIPESLRDRAELVREREEQLLGYQTILDGRKKRLRRESKRVADVWDAANPGYLLNDLGRRDISRFVEKLGVHEVVEAMEIAVDKFAGRDERQRLDNTFKYFCGICWKKLRDQEAR